MTPVNFRKTLLSLAILGASLSAHAETLTLTDSGLQIEDKRYLETVEVTGSYTGSDDAVEFNGVAFVKDLVINAAISGKGTFADGVDLSEADGDLFTPVTIGGNLINKGSISVEGNAVAALLVDPAEIEGDLINLGTLQVKGDEAEGEGVRALEFSGQSRLHGNLVNAKGGQILAEGEDARGILVLGNVIVSGDLLNEQGAEISVEGTNATAIHFEGGVLKGSLINRGVIRAQGEDAVAVDATSYGERGDRVDITAIENHGTIIARGEDAIGLKLDGVSFTGDNRHVVNTGTIETDDAAIEIEQFDLDGSGHALHIVNEGGTIISGDEAIDASFASGAVHFDWNGGSITGNLIGLDNIEVRGNAVFTGTDATADGANIRMAKVQNGKGWINIGSEKGDVAGSLELKAPHTSIDGNLYVAGNSSLILNLTNETDVNKAVLSVTDTAEFGSGSSLVLAAQAADFSEAGQRYKLIEAGEIIDKGLVVKSSNQLLTVSGVKIGKTTIGADLTPVASEQEPGGNQPEPGDNGEQPEIPVQPGTGSGGQTGVVEIITKSPEQFKETILAGGGSRNAQAAGASFVRLASKLPTSVLNAFDGVSEAQAAKLIEQTAPETNGGATQAAVTGQTLVSNVTGNRTSSIRGQSSGDALTETGVWVQALYSDASQDLRDGVAGYNAYSRGIAIGADGKLDEHTTVGIAYSALNTDVNGNTGNKTEVTGHSFTLYGGYEQGNYFVDGSLSYGFNDNESKRRVLGETAKADYDSSVLGVNLVGGYTYHLSNEALIEPRVAARYSLVDIDSYREKGAALALRSEDQRYEVFELGAGVRVAGNVQVGQGTLQPQARLMAYHDFAADRASSTSTFVLGDTPFVTTGAKPVRNSYEAGLGADYRLGAVTLGLNYDYLGKSGFDADTFTAKVRYDF